MAALAALRGGALSDGIHASAAQGFERGAEDYERGRPGYPAAAVDLFAAEFGLGPGKTVVDLAAGTGKLTRGVLTTGAHVIAVEPVAGMRAQLARAVPGAELHDGRAEAIPLPDASADALFVAQAFHWFDIPAAAHEIHRVLQPGGGLGVIWNVWDERVAWVRRMRGLLDAHRGDTPQRTRSDWRAQLAATGLFTPLTERTVPNPVHAGIDVVLARIASISFIASLPDSERAALLDEVRASVAAAPEAWEGEEVVTPYVTEVTWARAVT